MWYNLSTQDSNSNIMNFIIKFHDTTMILMILIMTSIIYIFFTMILNKFIDRNLLEGHLIELIWTLIPMILLISIAMPSLKILYLTDEMFKPSISIKASGHQWYWSYEYCEFKNIMYDSFMVETWNIKMFRLLDVDNRLIVPSKTSIRMIITSTDVIHSWTIPSMGIKIDAIPGRLNQIMFSSIRPGVFFGQCSEICGINHSFMPIGIEITSINIFYNWMNSTKN